MTETEPEEPPPGGRRKGDKPMISWSTIFQTVMGICATLLTYAIVGMYGAVERIEDVQLRMQAVQEASAENIMTHRDWAMERSALVTEFRSMGDTHVDLREYRDGLQAIRDEIAALRRAIENQGGGV